MRLTVPVRDNGAIDAEQIRRDWHKARAQEKSQAAKRGRYTGDSARFRAWLADRFPVGSAFTLEDIRQDWKLWSYVRNAIATLERLGFICADAGSWRVVRPIPIAHRLTATVVRRAA